MAENRSPLGRFDPLEIDHPSVGEPCLICRAPMLAGQIPTLISIIPADLEEANKMATGRPYNAVAGIAHQDCAWPS